MKFFTFALLAVFMIGIALPAEQAFARYGDDDSHQDDSYGRYDDSDDDEYEDGDDDSDEYEDSDEDSDSYTAPITPIRPVGSMTDAERLTLLQQLLARVIELLNQLKGIQTTTPSTPVVTTPTPTPTQSYTAAEVATHNTSSSCWSIINSKVYDLTSYISRHPGGSSNIMRICGEDGTSAFMGQHGGSSKPERTLAGFYLAPLAR